MDAVEHFLTLGEPEQARLRSGRARGGKSAMDKWMDEAIRARRVAALQEAGHVVVAHRLGLCPRKVGIQGNRSLQQLGVTWHEDSRDEETIILVYAGVAAEWLFDPETANPGRARDDYEDAGELLPFVEGDQATLKARAAELVARHRAEIETVAQALFEYSVLDGDEASMVVEAVEDGKDWRPALEQWRALKAASAPEANANSAGDAVPRLNVVAKSRPTGSKPELGGRG